MLKDAARLLKVSFEELKTYDTRPPLDEMKRATAENPQYAFAFRRMIESKLSPEELVRFVEGKVASKKK